MPVRPFVADLDRWLAPVFLAAVVALAGCSATFGSRTPTTSPEPGPVQPLAFPAAPVPLTEDSAAASEEAYRHNAVLAANSGVTAIAVSWETQSVETAEDTLTVTVGCGFSWEFEEDDAIAIADGVPYEATYRVTESGLTERVGSTI